MENISQEPEKPQVEVPEKDTLKAFCGLIQRGMYNEKEQWVPDPAGSIKPPVIAGLFERIAVGEPQYREWEIPKGNGKVRRIQAPHDLIADVQSELLGVLNHANLPHGVYGFAPGWDTTRGLRSMMHGVLASGKDAQLHGVYETDITDFFPSVTQEQVREVVYHYFWRILHRWEKGPKLPDDLINRLADMTAELCCLRGRLPQGSPTSPMLANMVGAGFDRVIQKNLQQATDGSAAHFEYGRYADDIVIMGTEHMPESLRRQVQSILSSFGFQISFPKTRYREGHKDSHPYRVWGMDLVPADKEKGTPLYFKVPQKDDQEVSILLNVLNQMGKLESESTTGMADLDYPYSLSMTMQRGGHKQEKTEAITLRQLLGRLSYFTAVTRNGGQPIKKDNEHHFLPPQTARQWTRFLQQYGKLLPKGYLKSFNRGETREQVVYDPVDIETFRARFSGLCEKRKYDPEKFQKTVQSLKQLLSDQYARLEGSDQRSFDVLFAGELTQVVDRYIREIPDTEVTEPEGSHQSVHTMLKSAMRDRKTSFEKSKKKSQLEYIIALLAAFADLYLDQKFAESHHFVREEDTQSTFLPEELEMLWEGDPEDPGLRPSLVQMDLKEGEKIILAKGLKFLFWKSEKRTRHVIIPSDSSNQASKKSYLLLPDGIQRVGQDIRKTEKKKNRRGRGKRGLIHLAQTMSPPQL